MNYSREEVYSLVGRDDKTATVIFKPGSESAKLYGPHVTVVFLYTQLEREDLDKLSADPVNKTVGFVRAKSLLSELFPEKKSKLEAEGINTNDIASILYFKKEEKNTFHSNTTRSITKINIPLRMLPKGRDLDWMYGVSKRFVSENIGLSPSERAFFLAGKLYYEPGKLTNAEREEIYPGGTFDSRIELEYLKIKYQREEAGELDIKRAGQIIRKEQDDDLELLKKYLLQAGSSLEKLAQQDIDEATRLLVRLRRYKERHFNVTGKVPVYLDKDRYLHVYMRHVEELKFNAVFQHKTNFQWQEEDVLTVLEKVVDKINPEIQQFFEKNQGSRFSRFGKKSVYFEGDYYTIHIEPNGSISTFHKNRKAAKQNDRQL